MESFSFGVSKFSMFNNIPTKRSQRKYKQFSSCQQTEVSPIISAISEQKADDMFYLENEKDSPGSRPVFHWISKLLICYSVYHLLFKKLWYFD